MADVLIVGCGDLGSGLAKQLVQKGHNVTAIRRTGLEFPANVTGVTGDVLFLTDDVLPEVEMIFLITTPSGRTEEAYEQAYLLPAQRLVERYRQQNVPPKLFFISSTSVYGQNNGEFLTEKSAAIPETPTASVLRITEQTLQQNLPTTVIRFSGIYGANRFRLIEDVLQGKVWTANKWTNRIHRDDCVAVLAFLAQCHWQNTLLDTLYIATDNQPVSIWEVKLWLATVVGVLPNLSGLAVDNFIPNSGKRLSNKALRDLGFEFQYPNYVAGYTDLLQKYQAMTDA
ncbi:NAD-dependent epimerase/dehydratase family protein [Marinomonas agarivorans]|nr:NAD-dependent epimerase/dehydratase family protein [Marinomonas agarivorans]